jgi:uncharacterized protein (DUF433 family)
MMSSHRVGPGRGSADQIDGVPCIRGLQIPVATVVGMIAEGMTAAEILDAYPDLELGDVQDSLRKPSRR